MLIKSDIKFQHEKGEKINEIKINYCLNLDKKRRRKFGGQKITR
jgi:hypothetical protein